MELVPVNLARVARPVTVIILAAPVAVVRDVRRGAIAPVEVAEQKQLPVVTTGIIKMITYVATVKQQVIPAAYNHVQRHVA